MILQRGMSVINATFANPRVDVYMNTFFKKHSYDTGCRQFNEISNGFNAFDVLNCYHFNAPNLEIFDLGYILI